jgi:hypothetical protein
MTSLSRGAGLLIFILFAFAAGASDAQQSLDDLYGLENLQYVEAAYGPLLAPVGGWAGELMFGFNTLSQRTRPDEKYKYFYGVALGGGGFSAGDVDLGRYDERDTGAGYGMIRFDFKLFATGEQSAVRPYIYGTLGYGSGYLWTEHITGEDDPPGTSSVFTAGVEGGFHVMVKNNRAITIGVGVDAGLFQFGGEALAAYPAMLTVGVCRWRGPLN